MAPRTSFLKDDTGTPVYHLRKFLPLEGYPCLGRDPVTDDALPGGFNLPTLKLPEMDEEMAAAYSKRYIQVALTFFLSLDLLSLAQNSLTLIAELVARDTSFRRHLIDEAARDKKSHHAVMDAYYSSVFISIIGSFIAGSRPETIEYVFEHNPALNAAVTEVGRLVEDGWFDEDIDLNNAATMSVFCDMAGYVTEHQVRDWTMRRCATSSQPQSSALN